MTQLLITILVALVLLWAVLLEIAGLFSAGSPGSFSRVRLPIVCASCARR